MAEIEEILLKKMWGSKNVEVVPFFLVKIIKNF